jgi:hypothetical protein
MNGDYIMIAEGTYKARGVSMSDCSSGEKGTPGYTVTLRIEDEGPNKNAMIEWVGWMTEKTEARTAESLVLLGYDGEDYKTVTRNDVMIVVEHETNTYTTATGEQKQGTRARVRWINDPARGGASMQPLDPGKALEMKARLKGLILQQRAAKPAATGTSFQHGANAPPAGGSPTTPKF